MLKKLFPWFNEEEELKKDERAETVIEQAKVVENRVRELAASYRAAGLVVAKVQQRR
jgi:hypothetical protein